MYKSSYDDMPGAITFVGGRDALLDYSMALSGTNLGDWMSILEYNALKAKGYPIDNANGEMWLANGKVNMQPGKGRKLIDNVWHAQIQPYQEGDWVSIHSYNFFKSKKIMTLDPMGNLLTADTRYVISTSSGPVSGAAQTKKLIGGIWHLKVLANQAPATGTTPPPVKDIVAGGTGTLILLGIVAWAMSRRKR